MTRLSLIAHINRKDAERDKFYCPCCQDRLDADDMDLASMFGTSKAMRERYGAMCCNGCTDDHYFTEDGVLVSGDDQVFSGSDGVYSSADALEDARAEGRAQSSHEATCRGWV